MQRDLLGILSGAEGVCLGVILCRVVAGPEVGALFPAASFILLSLQCRRAWLFFSGSGWSLVR